MSAGPPLPDLTPTNVLPMNPSGLNCNANNNNAQLTPPPLGNESNSTLTPVMSPTTANTVVIPQHVANVKENENQGQGPPLIEEEEDGII